jgi:cell division protein FtsB
MNHLAKRLHLGTVAGVLVAGYIGFYLIGTVRHNYELQRQINSLKQQITDINLDKDQLALKNEYYKTENYKEKQARAKLGLQAPDEKVIILPQSHDKSQPQAEEKPVKKQSNFSQWVDFLLGRA